MSKSDLLREIKRAVEAKKTESSQRLAVVKLLAGAGYRKQPSVKQGSDGKGTVRFYAWMDSPAGDIVLVTGPTVVGEVYTVAELDKMPAGPGFVVYAADADLRDKVKADIERAQSGSPKAKAPKAASKPRAPRAPKPAPPPVPRFTSVQQTGSWSAGSPRGRGSYPRTMSDDAVSAAVERRQRLDAAPRAAGRYTSFAAAQRAPSPRGTGAYPRTAPMMAAPAPAPAAGGMSAHDQAMMAQLQAIMANIIKQG